MLRLVSDERGCLSIITQSWPWDSQIENCQMMMYGSKSLFCEFYSKYGILIKGLESAGRFATGQLCVGVGLKFQVAIESSVNLLLTKVRQNECAYYKISVKG